ncbi:LacI family DNA-binding transcriptional regulator [Parasphaerochaeta coccoides]|uniref:Transcriptional regulator, LacI family n=1 Tax=Parasphaerochaeta coccoides (strain ATCC BAA-1237 / DSM 17374 / SPN1) TaxID=760011 RepID=F4GKH8_PARC1|nr:LacI family DNA-binding transcriptional regulator [Parasphaerochaeta coccoides]AEC02861.1 transcriptional regulator, LacI family [Parasphaerochaeta coccoides DSM 17374]
MKKRKDSTAELPQVAATIKDVAELSRVSIATVSRVMNNIGVVNPETEKRVRAAIATLDYRRNNVARALKMRSTRTIGFICPDLSNIFFTEIVDRIENILGPLGYSLVVCSSAHSVDEEKRKVSILLDRNVDGIIAAPAGNAHDAFSPCARAHVPVVFIDRVVPGASYDVVLTDNHRGAYEATEALIREGHRKIGFLGGTLDVYTTRERLAGYEQALQDNGITVDERFLFFGGMSLGDGSLLMRKALSQDDAPEAYFLVNELVHVGASAYLLEEVPLAERSRIVFASFDYMHYAPLLRFCHYAVAQQVAAIGAEAAALIRRRIDGDRAGFPANIMLKPEIKVMINNGGIISNPEFLPVGLGKKTAFRDSAGVAKD